VLAGDVAAWLEAAGCAGGVVGAAGCV